MIFSSFWKLIISNFSIADNFSLKKTKLLLLKTNTLQETNKLGNFFCFFISWFLYICKTKSDKI